MKRNLTLLLAALSFTTATHAQNWTVGVPVDFVLSDYQYFFGGGCYPNADQTFNFPISSVSGVLHAGIVTALTPAGGVAVVPGPAGLALGDTIWLTSTGARSVYFNTGAGGLSLEFHAIGTPTTAGQQHPCAFNNLWISNLGICPDGLSHGINTPCTVQPGSVGVDEAAAHDANQLPSEANGWVLHAPEARRIQLFDARGTLAATFTGARAQAGYLVAGIYLARMLTADGTMRVVRFAKGDQAF